MLKNREPVQGEFFSAESIDSVAESLVREAIQNSLDATLPGRKTGVRFVVSASNAGLEPSKVMPFLEGLWPHVSAASSQAAGLADEPCRFLLVEDKSTTGLRGDVRSHTPAPEGTPDDFYYFFRAEGRSGKQSGKRGSWGIGKYTFAATSQINTFLGLTVRRAPDTGPYLMGQAILRSHHLDGGHFVPDGWWSELHGEIPVPTTDPQVLEAFRNTFGIGRRDEPGLSIVVPYVSERLDVEALQRAVLHHYSISIARGELEVEVRDSTGIGIMLDSPHLDEALDLISDSPWVAEVRKEIELVRWADDDPPADRIIVANRIANRPGAKDNVLLSPDVTARVREMAVDHEPFVIKLPVKVDELDDEADAVWGDLTIIYGPVGDGTTKPTFFREGIRVADVKGGSLPGLQALVLAEPGPLATMLGRAEGPAHVDWTPSTEKFKNRYADGKRWLAFVKNGPSKLLEAAREADRQVDRSLTSGFFSRPKPVPGSSGSPAKPRMILDMPDRPESVKGIKVGRLDSGFAVKVDRRLDPSDRLVVRVAYDIRRGNPLVKWKSSDFDLTTIDIAASGLEIVSRDGNRIVAIPAASVSSEAAGLLVRGFDANRDLYIETTVEQPA